MSSREQLIENYEDALFALMMDEVARSEGERLLKENEALKNDAAAAVPPALHKRCLQTIRNALLRQKSGASVRCAGRLLVRLAAAVLVTAALFSAAFAASPAFRATTLNLLMSMNDELVEWVPSDEESPSLALTVDEDWLPEGYTLTEETYDDFTTMLLYQNNAGNILYITRLQCNADSVVQADKEDADEWVEVSVHGEPGVIVVKHGQTSLSWVDNHAGFYTSLVTDDLSADQLLSIAETIATRSK